MRKEVAKYTNIIQAPRKKFHTRNPIVANGDRYIKDVCDL
jgi:hypothetical protein